MKMNDGYELCCGCSACSLVCPKECITIQENEEGFYQAFTDFDKCIHCGKCDLVCPMKEKRCNEIKGAYAFASKDQDIYARSASGGFFSHAAMKIMNSGGSVWGCGYNENLLAQHMRIQSINELDRLRRSKYVQSYIGDSFRLIHQELTEERLVLFVGTPCQVSGLKNYLNKDYKNLYTIDLLCHGTPSPKMFRENLESDKRKIKNYEFRQKTNYKYDGYVVTKEFENGEIDSQPYYKDAYYNEFYDGTSLNLCCYSCPYTNLSRCGDISIGDFEWGRKYHSEFNKFREINCVLVNTDKGESLFNSIENGVCCETSLENIEEKSISLLHPALKPDYRNDIYNEIKSKGYPEWKRRYFRSFRYLKKTPLLASLIRIKILLNGLKNGL